MLSMPLCEVSASHDGPSASGGTTEALPTTTKVDHAGNGSAHRPATSMTGSWPSHSFATSGHRPSAQNSGNHHSPPNEFPHPGMNYMGSNANRSTTTSDGNPNHPSQGEVPFAPRSSTANLNAPYSSCRTPTRVIPPRPHGRSSQRRTSSRKPVPTQPLAATIGVTTATSKLPDGRKPTVANGFTSASAASLRRQQPSRPHPPRSKPKKRSLPLVMEINKLVIPKGFLPAKGEKSDEDLYAKIPLLWAKRSNPDDIYVNWTNPDSKSLWELTRILPRGPRGVPAKPPPPPPTPGTPCSESSVSTWASPQGKLAGRNLRRCTGASVVSQVYADSRYIGVVPKKARLMRQSIMTRNKFGPLDLAKFRDYRILPIDYYVTPLEGFRLVDLEENGTVGDYDCLNNEDAVGGRPKRTRRHAQQKRSLSTPTPKEKKKKRRQISKTSVFIGNSHQADVPPRPYATAYKIDRSLYQDSSYTSDDGRDEQIWDPRRADAAKLRGENIDGFLAPARELNSQVLLLQALHQADYCVSKAELKFVDLYRASKEPSTEMSDREKAKADSMFETSRKDFAGIARVLNRSVAAVIVQYYYWKSIEKKGGTGGYARLKNLWKNEDDLCCICDDGGILIVCEHCHKSFHLECLKPPLKEAPKTDWYCSQCLKSPAKLRRLPSLSLGTDVDDLGQPDDAKPRAMKVLSFSTQGTTAANQGQVPLMPSLEQVPRKSQAENNVIDLTDD